MRRLASAARVVFEQGGPVFDGFGIACLPHHQDSDREDTMIDLFQIRDSKPKVTGRRNVSGLAIEQVLRGVAMKFLGVGGNAIRIVLTQRRRTPLAPRLFNRLQFDRVHRDRICRRQQNAGLIDKVLHLGERTAMPYLPHAVHDMQYRF